MNKEMLISHGISLLVKQAQGKRIDSRDATRTINSLLNFHGGDRTLYDTIIECFSEIIPGAWRSREYFYTQWGIVDPERVDYKPSKFTMIDALTFRRVLRGLYKDGYSRAAIARLENKLAGDF